MRLNHHGTTCHMNKAAVQLFVTAPSCYETDLSLNSESQQSKHRDRPKCQSLLLSIIHCRRSQSLDYLGLTVICFEPISH
jgi:hypothetical protein